jgi:dGTPase
MNAPSEELGLDWRRREALLLAPYAMHGCDTAGRVYDEPPHPYRGPYQRDRDRVIHAAAFRRLSHKTQVFMGEQGDYHRSRLTHTLEVASIARTLARALRLNEDLVEALAMAHDLGHPPFGHAGEDTLHDCLRDDGGFNHNAHALRLVEEIEQRYPGFPGLNLSRETLDGQRARADKLRRGQRPLLEAQVVDAADSVAYDTHDADDALDLGLVTFADLVTLPLWGEAAQRVRRRHPNVAGRELERAVVHELVDWQVGDLLRVATDRLAAWRLDAPAAVQAAPLVVEPSAELAPLKAQLEAFLYDRVYRHPQVLAGRAHAQAALRGMFERLVDRPQNMPVRFQRRAESLGIRRAVGDYLAGMTDRYAVEMASRVAR